MNIVLNLTKLYDKKRHMSLKVTGTTTISNDSSSFAISSGGLVIGGHITINGSGTITSDHIVTGTLSQNFTPRFVLGSHSEAPSSPATGQLYFDTSRGQMMFYDGNRWNAVMGSPVL